MNTPAITDRLAAALRDLLKHPYPHDLLAIRTNIDVNFDGDDELAKEELEAWCSEAFAKAALEAHRKARDTAIEVLGDLGLERIAKAEGQGPLVTCPVPDKPD